VSRPEKGLQKRVNLMQQTTNSDLSRHYLPRQLRHLILQEYLSGVKTARQLSEEHGIPMSTIHKLGQRWKAKNSCSFVSTPNPYPIMSRVTSEEASELLSENKALRRRLEEALLRLEGYEIMGDILQEEYGIDLLKKSAAGQSSVSKKDTQQ
jgi:transposase-like protein